jgi:membrane protein implicated in regulation of membrane protease activity
VRWFKVAAVIVGVMVVFMIVSSIVGFLLEAVIAVLAVAAVVLGVMVASSRRRGLSKHASAEVRGLRYRRSLRRHNPSDVDEDLARLKRQTGG